MNTARILAAASLALTATVAASALATAATGGHAYAGYRGGMGRSDRGGAGSPGRLSLRDDSRFRLPGPGGGFGAPHRYGWRRHRAYGVGYPYWGGGFDGDYEGYGPDGYGPDGYGPAGFGPEGPPDMGYPPFARPMSPALAPLAYGPGVHDGGYAYGYNGYAQTPPLPIGYYGTNWSASAGVRPCGC